MTRVEDRTACLDAMEKAFYDMQKELGYTPNRGHPDTRICLAAAFDALPLAGARVVLTIPPEKKP